MLRSHAAVCDLSSFCALSVDDVIDAILLSTAPLVNFQRIFSKTMRMCWRHSSPNSPNCLIGRCHPECSIHAAYMTPLLKKPDLYPSDGKSYRLISNLTVLSKVLERLVARQLIRHLSDWKLLPELQSAYRAYHSTDCSTRSRYRHSRSTGSQRSGSSYAARPICRV